MAAICVNNLKDFQTKNILSRPEHSWVFLIMSRPYSSKHLRVAQIEASKCIINNLSIERSHDRIPFAAVLKLGIFVLPTTQLYKWLPG